MSEIPARQDRMPVTKPTAGPLLSAEDVLAMALSTFVPGPAELISPRGRGVRVILFSLKKCGWKIVPMTREDFGNG